MGSCEWRDRSTAEYRRVRASFACPATGHGANQGKSLNSRVGVSHYVSSSQEQYMFCYLALLEASHRLLKQSSRMKEQHLGSIMQEAERQSKQYDTEVLHENCL